MYIKLKRRHHEEMVVKFPDVWECHMKGVNLGGRLSVIQVYEGTTYMCAVFYIYFMSTMVAWLKCDIS